MENGDDWNFCPRCGDPREACNCPCDECDEDFPCWSVGQCIREASSEDKT